MDSSSTEVVQTKEEREDKQNAAASVLVTFGTGAIQSPPDERDFQIEDLYAAAGVDLAAITLPATYVVPGRPPVLNQGNTPMCVAYSTSAMKSYQDYDDQTPRKFWNFDEPRFFTQIGGTSQGAYLRTAMDRLRNYGYPVVTIGQASKHKIRAYYAVPKDILSIKTALKTYGLLVMARPWYHSWMKSPESPVNYMLPRPDYQIGGHAIVIDGWDDNRKALRLRNSWGSVWGYGGDAFMPYAYIGSIWEIWKAIDL